MTSQTPSQPSPATPSNASAHVAVVLGKPNLRADEEKAIFFIGRAMARRGITLYTTSSPGTGLTITAGYAAEGETAKFVNRDSLPKILSAATMVLVFTDTKYQRELTQKDPQWRERDWLVFHNPKAITQAATHIGNIMKERGTPVDGGSQSR